MRLFSCTKYKEILKRAHPEATLMWYRFAAKSRFRHRKGGKRCTSSKPTRATLDSLLHAQNHTSAIQYRHHGRVRKSCETKKVIRADRSAVFRVSRAAGKATLSDGT